MDHTAARKCWKYVTVSICLSLMASTTVKMTGKQKTKFREVNDRAQTSKSFKDLRRIISGGIAFLYAQEAQERD